jgi:GNAT superfamily N-acetyltransferase
MVDMLVRLYDLPEAPVAPPAGIGVRRALAAEKSRVAGWVAEVFGRGWADECDAAFCRQPVCCFLAVEMTRPVGFCVYDSTARGVAGPIGIARKWRGKGVGRALLLATLADMRSAGYAYGVVGWVGSPEFFSRVCDAASIEGSEPGLYANLLADTMSR